MLKNIYIFLTITAAILLMVGCKKNSPTEPQPTKPPGYQEDIPWPSLADSPWPMNHHDPQNTGRTNQVVSLAGIIEHHKESVYMEASFVADKDSNIIFLAKAGLFSLKNDGTIDTILGDQLNLYLGYSTPLLGSDGTIYFTGGETGYFYAVKNDTIKWSYFTGAALQQLGINIDLQENIYLLANNQNLIALDKNGNLLWELFNQDFLNSSAMVLPFSPDGQTIYIPGINSMINAVDINNHTLKWQFGEGLSSTAAMVDYYGNIYVQNSKFFYCLRDDGTVKWNFLHDGNIQRQYYGEGTIDKNGNVYFTSDSLYSLDYNGNFRWSRGIKGVPLSSLICDGNNNIYSVTGDYDMWITAVDSNGNLLWETEAPGINIAGDGPIIAFSRLYIPTYHGGLYVIK